MIIIMTLDIYSLKIIEMTHSKLWYEKRKQELQEMLEVTKGDLTIKQLKEKLEQVQTFINNQ